MRAILVSVVAVSVLFAGGAAAFAAVELVRKNPMIELRLLGQPRFATSISGALFTGVAVIGHESVTTIGADPAQEHGRPRASRERHGPERYAYGRRPGNP